MKIGLEQVDVFVFNSVRLTVSALVLAICAWLERRRGIKPLPGVAWPKVAVYGLSISAVYQLLFLLGISRTSSAATGLIIATVPLWTAVFACLFASERLAGGAWGGLAIALAGTVVVTLQQGAASGGEQPLLGNLIVLLAAMTWAGGTVYSRSLLKRVSPLRLAASAAVISLPVHWSVAAGRYAEAAPAFGSTSLVLIILYSGVLSSGLALPMWSIGVRHAGAAHASVIQNLVPLVAILAAWPIRGETPPLSQLGGGALILGGLVLMRRFRG